MIYLIYDTDCESPRVRDVLYGPKGSDIEKISREYHSRHKHRSRDDFVKWLCRFRDFVRVNYESAEVIDNSPPYYERPPRKGTPERQLHDMMKDTMDVVLKAYAENTITALADSQKAWDTIWKRPKKIQFDVQK